MAVRPGSSAGRLGRVNAKVILKPRDKSWADETLNRESGWSIENAKILWEHGVEFAVLPANTPYAGINGRGISTMGVGGRDLMNLPLAAAYTIRGGLPQEAALRALTLDAAEILGVEDRIGSLEVGKDADLIITDGDVFHYNHLRAVGGHRRPGRLRQASDALLRPCASASGAGSRRRCSDAVLEAIEAETEEPTEPAPEPDDPEGGR